VNILVVLRMMPDAVGELQLMEDCRSIDREWLDFQLNDFDDHALEDAILLKESLGARVTVLGVGEGTTRVLQMASARGADEVISLPTDPDAIVSSRAIAATVAELALARQADLVITGVQSPEDVFGALAPYVGALLRWPHVSGTNRIAARDGLLLVSQERGAGGSVTYEVTLPAVLGVQTATKAPRYVSGSKLREASKTPIGRIEARADGFAAEAEIVSLRLPTGGDVEWLGGDADAVADRIAAILAESGSTRS